MWSIKLTDVSYTVKWLYSTVICILQYRNIVFYYYFPMPSSCYFSGFMTAALYIKNFIPHIITEYNMVHVRKQGINEVFDFE